MLSLFFLSILIGRSNGDLYFDVCEILFEEEMMYDCDGSNDRLPHCACIDKVKRVLDRKKNAVSFIKKDVESKLVVLDLHFRVKSRCSDYCTVTDVVFDRHSENESQSRKRCFQKCLEYVYDAHVREIDDIFDSELG
jgi:hypothetical protein